MNEVRIIPAEYKHCRMLAENLCPEDREEILNAGFVPYKAIWKSYKSSFLCRTAFVGDDIAAMFGVCGDALGTEARPWLLTTPIIYEIPFAFVKKYRRGVKELSAIYPLLYNYVDAKHEKACNVLELCGFKLDEPMPYGITGHLFRRYSVCSEAA